jgi:HEAT repeat protein
MTDVDFQPYLASIATTYKKWWQLYTLTDAEGRQQQEQAPDFFDFGLIVQTVPKSEREQLQGRDSEQQQAKIERFSVLEGLRKYALEATPEQVLLIGRPGSGKSTALARLMLEEAALTPSPSPNVGRGEPERISVLVELRYWQGSITQLILDAFNRHDLSVTKVQLDTVLARSFVLFDGVNELPSEEARSQLMEFRRNHSNLPMIFTSRDVSLGGDLGIERKLEMQPLTEAQMQQFIRAYVPEQAEQMLRQLSERLREFGQTPLLLWMLCEVFQQAPDNQLPSNLGGVFQAFTKMYEGSSVRKHDVALLKGDVRPLSDRRLWKKALMAIATIMMQGKTSIDFRVAIHRDEAEQELQKLFADEQFPVRDILDDLLKYHLLQNRSADQIEFRHQLLQEYYAAEALLRQLPSLTDTQLKQDYLNYLKWTESLVLMLALVDNQVQAVGVVRQALEVDLVLGARLAGAVKPEFQEKTIQLVDDLESPDWLKVQLLGETRSEFSITGLCKAIKHSDDCVRGSSAIVLGELGSDKVISVLRIAVEDSNATVRWHATEALGKLRSEATIPALLIAIRDIDLFVFSSATNALVKLGSKEAIPGLRDVLEDIHSSKRSAIAHVLEALGSDEVISGLSMITENLNEEVSEYTIDALENLDLEQKIHKLVNAFENVNAKVRWCAVNTLVSLGSEEAIPRLLNALEHENYDVRWCATYTLEILDLKQAIPGLCKALEHENSDVRRGAVRVLGKLGSEAAISGLLKALKDQDPFVRTIAAQALGNLGSDHVIPELLNALTDKDSSVRSSAAQALGNLGSDHVIPELLNAIKDPDSFVRASVACALGQLGSEKVIPELLNLIKDSEPYVRGEAVKALGQLGSKTVIPILLKALEDSASHVREMVTEALATIAKNDIEALSPHLPKLFTLIPTASVEEAYHVILAIQVNCKYYNYEIYQAHLEAQQHDQSEDQSMNQPRETHNHFPNASIVKIFEQVDEYNEVLPKDLSS